MSIIDDGGIGKVYDAIKRAMENGSLESLPKMADALEKARDSGYLDKLQKQLLALEDVSSSPRFQSTMVDVAKVAEMVRQIEENPGGVGQFQATYSEIATCLVALHHNFAGTGSTFDVAISGVEGGSAEIYEADFEVAAGDQDGEVGDMLLIADFATAEIIRKAKESEDTAGAIDRESEQIDFHIHREIDEQIDGHRFYLSITMNNKKEFDRLVNDLDRVMDLSNRSRGIKEDLELQNQLRSFMEGAFNEEDIQRICFDLKIDYEDVDGKTRNGKIIGLIKHYKRHHNSLDGLVSKCKELRPHKEWPEI